MSFVSISTTASSVTDSVLSVLFFLVPVVAATVFIFDREVGFFLAAVRAVFRLLAVEVFFILVLVLFLGSTLLLSLVRAVVRFLEVVVFAVDRVFFATVVVRREAARFFVSALWDTVRLPAVFLAGVFFVRLLADLTAAAESLVGPSVLDIIRSIAPVVPSTA